MIRILLDDGWYSIHSNGDHKHFKHPEKRGKVTVPHPVKDLKKGTIGSILRQAGLK